MNRTRLIVVILALAGALGGLAWMGQPDAAVAEEPALRTVRFKSPRRSPITDRLDGHEAARVAAADVPTPAPEVVSTPDAPAESTEARASVADKLSRRYLDRAIADAKSKPRPYLGVVPASSRNLNDFVKHHLSITGWATVGKVIPKGPADQAGLKSEDLITAVDGAPVKDSADFVRQMVDGHRPGDTVVLTVMREGSPRSLPLKLGTRDDNPQRPYIGIESGHGRANSDALFGNLGVTGGYLVQQVREDTGADLAGLQPYDILLTLGGHEIDSRTLHKALAKFVPEDVVVVEFLRDGLRRSASVTLGEYPQNNQRLKGNKRGNW